MTWPVRGIARGVPERWPAVRTASSLPSWTDDCATKVTSCPVALGKTRVLILSIGESGMVGVGHLTDSLPAGYPTSDGSLWTYDGTRGWCVAAEPSYGPQPNMTPGVSAALLFCWRLQVALGSAYEVGLITSGKGGTTSVDWAVGGTLYNLAVANTLEALAESRTVLGAILHEQGINDSYFDISTGWGARWSAIETQLRADLGGSTVPLYFAKQHAAIPNIGAGDVNPTNWAALRAEQDAWASSNRFKVVKPEGPWIDNNTHLATSAQIVLSQGYMDAWTAHPGHTT
jgi:hypothetical protein